MTELAKWNTVVDKRSRELSTQELCIAVHMVDQLSAELDEMIASNVSKESLMATGTELDDWIQYLNGVILYWSRLGTGPDLEQEWEIDQAWKQKEKEEERRRHLKGNL